MITYPQILGLVAAAFVAGSFIASPELRAYAANTVFSTDIVNGQVMTVDLANNAVTAAKIKDGEVKAPEIATDAVGAAELQGVTKLLFGQCVPTNNQKTTSIDPGRGWLVTCNIAGVDADDSASATLNDSTPCFDASVANPGAGSVSVFVYNECTGKNALGSNTSIAVIVYDK